MARFVHDHTVVSDTHGTLSPDAVVRVARWLLVLSAVGLLAVAVLWESTEHVHTDKVAEITGTRRGN